MAKGKSKEVDGLAASGGGVGGGVGNRKEEVWEKEKEGRERRLRERKEKMVLDARR